MIRLRVEFLNGRSPGYSELRNTIRKYHIGVAGHVGTGAGKGTRRQPSL